MNAIKKRQYYFWLGKAYEVEEEWEKAIEAYKQYSSFLEEKDKHIPHLWISKIYDKRGDKKNAILHLKEYSKGCSTSKQNSINQEIKEREQKLRLNPLKCPNCNAYRKLEIKLVRFEEDNKGVDYNVPFYACPECGNSEPLNTLEEWKMMAKKDRQGLEDGEYVHMVFKYENKRFPQYEHLDFKYDSTDYYLIPGLMSPWDDGFLTPVFFDNDLLLYYNNHPDYSVRLFSFSSGNIYYKREPLFRWGFGINRSGKIFKWLGDLDNDLSDENMKPHLRRFQASNIDSDHDIYSKFYLSQIPYSPDEMFQESDNEYKIFNLKREFEEAIRNKFSIRFSKLDIENLSEYYLLEDRHQIFSAFLSLSKYLIENIQQDELKKILKKNGVSNDELKGLRSLKLFEKFLQHVLNIENSGTIISPLYVLYDLRQFHGHLAEESFEERYNFCKERIGLSLDSTDFEVYQELNKKLIEMFNKINKVANKG